VYVDDIAFGGSSSSLVARFAEDMSREFEMSMMGELQFFLGLQIKQSKEVTFVHQGHCAEVQDGGFQGCDDADEYDYSS
jgi:hypothetical protein